MRRALLLAPLAACTFVRAGALDDLERGTTTANCAPDPAELSDVTALSAGERHVCVVRAAGGVLCWGRNDAGETAQPNTPKSPPSIVRLGQAHVAVSAGGQHTCARAADGTFTCWGNNGYGQLGEGLPRNFDVTPPTTLMRSGQAFVGDQVAAGKLDTYLLDRGAVYATGSNDYGQLGLDASNGPENVVRISGVTATKLATHASAQFACALGADSVLCWGLNDHNELGVATTTLCGGATGCSWQSVAPLPKTFVHPARDLAVGAHHACALDATGALFCWGVSDAGQTGDTATLPEIWAAHVVPDIPKGRRVAAGVSHTCVVTETSEVWCLGSNSNGELGPTLPVLPTGGEPTPQRVPNLEATEISAGDGFTCALSCGSVRCWGRNDDGQLGAASVSADGFSHVRAP
jgi:alpha-tubulin suppressor-like RCC1 family protein